MALRIAALMILAALAGCAGTPEECEPLCGEARQRVEGCLDEWGLEWGDELGYADPQDYDDWCQTYLWEQLQIATERWGALEGREEIAVRCGEQHAALEGGDCAAYAASWAVWDEVVQPPVTGR